MKVKMFFKKIINYIKTTVWVAPLLIVVVVFIVLFSLNPIATGIGNLWKWATTTNNMDKITYQEYVEKVQYQAEHAVAEDMVIVFSRSGCEYCPTFYKSVNKYLKSSAYTSAGFKIYNVDVSVKSSKVEIDGTKYTLYKDSTLGLLSTATTSNEEVLAKDYLLQLDKRIQEFANLESGELQTVSDSAYTYVSTPLIIWYHNGLEQRISNSFENSSILSWETDSSGNKKNATELSFRKYIQDFADGKGSQAEVDWTNPFDLSYNKEKL